MPSLPDFLKPLETLVRPFPHEAVAAAIAQRDEALPHLLHAIEWADEHADEANHAQPPYMLHLFALFLLAQLRETRAYPLIAQLARNPALEALTGDVVTEHLSNILASVCGGDTSLIEELIEDPQVEEFVRGAAICSLGVLLHSGLKTRAQISAYVGELFARRLDRKPSHAWDSAISLCTDFQFAEHLEAIRESYRAQFADPFCDALEDVEVELLLPPGASTRMRPERYELIDDTTAEMASWWCFNPDSAAEDALDDADLFEEELLAGELDDEYESATAGAAVPVVREFPKIGHDDPCPCASGKKFKKCCGAA